MFYPLSLIAISVTSCCVGLSLRSRDYQTGSGSGRYEIVTPTKRAVNCQRQQRASSDDDDDEASTAAAAAQFCQMNCDSSSTLDRSSTRRTRVPPVPGVLPPDPRVPRVPLVPSLSWVLPVPLVPPVPPAPANHLDPSQRSLPFMYRTYMDGSDDKDHSDNVDRRRPSPANTLPLSRSNSRSNSRPSKCHPDVGCTLTSADYLPMGRVATSTRPAGPEKTMADDRRRLDRIERCVDMSLFVLLVLICVGLAVCLVFMYF